MSKKKFWVAPFPLQPWETKFEIERVEYNRNGSGNGQGHYRAFGHAVIDRKTVHVMVVAFTQGHGKEHDQKWHAENGDHWLAVDLDNPMRWGVGYAQFKSQVEAAIEEFDEANFDWSQVLNPTES